MKKFLAGLIVAGILTACGSTTATPSFSPTAVQDGREVTSNQPVTVSNPYAEQIRAELPEYYTGINDSTIDQTGQAVCNAASVLAKSTTPAQGAYLMAKVGADSFHVSLNEGARIALTFMNVYCPVT